MQFLLPKKEKKKNKHVAYCLFVMMGLDTFVVVVVVVLFC